MCVSGHVCPARLSAGHGAGLMLDSPQRRVLPSYLGYEELLNVMIGGEWCLSSFCQSQPQMLWLSLSPNSHLSFARLTGIIIVAPPVPASVPPNYPVTLRMQAEGHGRLVYQWFTFKNDEVHFRHNIDLKRMNYIANDIKSVKCISKDHLLHHFTFSNPFLSKYENTSLIAPV